MSEYEEVETAVAVVEVNDRSVERRAENDRRAESEARRIALSFALTGVPNGYSRLASDKRKPDEIVAAAEKYYAFLVAGRKP